MAEDEIKRLLDQIESSYQAAQRALTSPAIMEKHEFIQHRMGEIEIAYQKIRSILGDEFAAMDIVVRKLAEADEKIV